MALVIICSFHSEFMSLLFQVIINPDFKAWPSFGLVWSMKLEIRGGRKKEWEWTDFPKVTEKELQNIRMLIKNICELIRATKGWRRCGLGPVLSFPEQEEKMILGGKPPGTSIGSGISGSLRDVLVGSWKEEMTPRPSGARARSERSISAVPFHTSAPNLPNQTAGL